MKDFIYPVLYGILFVAGIACLGYMGWLAADFVTEKQEIAECIKWQGYAERLETYYILDWQEAQCNFRGIIINAPVK